MESHQENLPENKRRCNYIIVREDEKLVDDDGTSAKAAEKKVPLFPSAKSYPPGYRFMPTDDELILEYLQKKVNNQPIPIHEITDVYLKQNNPKALAETYPKVGENEWYFFTPRDRKYPNGSRPNRAADTGYWKATGADKPVRFQNEIIGYRKALVFYQGKPPKGLKTSWIMHEFRLNRPPRRKTNANDMRLDDWVLCRIYEKASRPSNRNRRGGNEVEQLQGGDHLVDDEFTYNPRANLQVMMNTPEDEENEDDALNVDEIKAPQLAVDNNITSASASDEVMMMRGYGDEWLQLAGFPNFVISPTDHLHHHPSHSLDIEPVLINGHLQSSILDYGLVNPVGQLQYHNKAFGQEEAAAAAATLAFQQLPMYFGPSTSTTTSTILDDDSFINVDVPTASFNGNSHYNHQFISRKRRLL